MSMCLLDHGIVGRVERICRNGVNITDIFIIRSYDRYEGFTWMWNGWLANLEVSIQFYLTQVCGQFDLVYMVFLKLSWINICINIKF